MFPWAAPQADGTDALVEEMHYLVERAVPRDNPLEAVLLCANGYAMRGELAWMNQSIFHRDPRVVCERLKPRFGDLFLAPLPGDTLTLSRRRRVAPMTRSPWISTLPEAAWPPRGAGARPTAPFGPATGKLTLDASARAALARVLEDFARFLYASSLFLEMYVLGPDATGGRRPTMVFALLEGDSVERAHADGGTVWVWDPNGCAFVQEPVERPEDEFVAGARCWASDLLAVLGVEMPAASLTVGRLTGWNAAPARLRFDLPNLLHMY